MEIETMPIEETPLQDDVHVLHMWTPFSLNIEKGYTYTPKSVIFKLLSNALYMVAVPILYGFNKLMYGFKIEGIENLRNIKGGKISVSNHIHPMDCTMNALLHIPAKLYFPALKSNFQIPVVRWIIRLLNAFPIPDTVESKKEFIKTIEQLLQQGKTVHFYPEGSLWPYCKRIRKFKKGAFEFAVENQVPVIPILYTCKEPTGIRKYFKKKPDIDVSILEPIYPQKELEKLEAIKDLMKKTQDQMKQKQEE